MSSKVKRRVSLGKSKKDSDVLVNYTVKDLPVLRRKRTIAYNRLSQTLEVGLKALQERSGLTLFLSHFTDVEKHRKSFDECHLSILSLEEDDEENVDQLQGQCDQVYYHILTLHRNLVPSDYVSEVTESDVNNSVHQPSSNIKLPKINLPNFSGDLKRWPAFYDTFNSLIHLNESLSDTERMHYLISCLTGDALALVSTFPVMGIYYGEAYNCLVKRYKNNRELAFTCWKEMLNFNLKSNSPEEYRRIFDTFNENLKILKTLDLPVEQWDFVLSYLVLSKLDSKTRCDFEEAHSSCEVPSYISLKEFIYKKCDALIRDSHFQEKDSKIPIPVTAGSSKTLSKFVKPQTNNFPYVSRFNKNSPVNSLVSDSAEVKTDQKCSFCQEAHAITNCKLFLNKSVDERHECAKQRQWCFNCLRTSHYLRECRSVFRCQKCKQKHHTLLHMDKEVVNEHGLPCTSSEATEDSHSCPTEEVNEPNPSALTTFTNQSVVLLSTANIQVMDSKGNYQTMRALIDCGSQAHFISESAARKLGFISSPVNKSVSGLGKTSSRVSGSITCCVGTGNVAYFNIDLLTLPIICGVMPSMHLNTSSWQHVKHLQLADPQCNIPGPIDVLLGAEVFMKLLLPGRIEGEANQPTAINSIFGWLLMGRTSVQTNQASNNLCAMFCSSDMSLNEEVKRLWELEDLPSSSELTPDEISCESKYLKGISRDESGRYIVPLPFKSEDKPEFPGSREIALRRFHLLEQRLLKNPELYQAYKDFLMDYIDNQHMSAVDVADVAKGDYYIPHHCVIRPESETTKLRVVFDASAVCACGQSLNDALLIGAKLQGNLITVLLRFRLHAVVFIGDVKQMFRQVKIRAEDQDYQRILWRFDPKHSIQEYRLNTVTYGTAAAPFLACRTIKQLVLDDGDNFPLASKVLNADIYVDDVTTGASSLEEAKVIKTEVINLLKRGGFELRKWASNVPDLLDDIRPEDCLHGSASFDDKTVKSLKVLGLKWNSTDHFTFDVVPCERECTKRNILSELARIFDPLGFLSPITFLAKRLIQILWVQGIGWDEPVPENVANQWRTYIEQLPLLKAIQIPRRITVGENVSYQLHGFADSSEAGYGAIVYLRAVDENEKVTVKLVCAKARVSPLKHQSLPRLELCAAVLLADLMQYVKRTFETDILIENIFAWSDSTVVLSWLQSHSSRWKTFVANRVSHIQELLPSSCWYHVSTNENPADICSRGALPKDLINNLLWWAGPAWLLKSSSHWPISVIEDPDQEIVDSEKRVTVLMVEQPVHLLDELLNKHSSLDKVIRIVANCLRFIHNIRKSATKTIGSLSNVERNNALRLFVKRIQDQHFFDDIQKLKNGKVLPKQLRKLNPFVDELGVLRVGGRLSRSGLAYEHKHPALLPRKSEFTERIVREIHRNNCHPGINTTHYLVSQQYWILSPKRAIRSALQNCVQCFRTNPKILEPFMSDLPVARVNAVKPFSIVGVDFGGPFNIKHGSHRGAKIGKAYLCLFVCFTTKAVHLEVVSDLSSEAFIAALRRFIARRGRCNIIHSDCGTNFVGAKNQLSELMRDAAEQNKVEFRFNPPSAPHFGGVWEIQIKAAKALLYRTVGIQCFTFEELYTLFSQIESTMNSRPLCPLSSDPNDINALTPGHFLTMEPLTSLPEEDLTDVRLYRLNRWQLIQQMHQGFWKRWSAEYLSSLTQRAKWTKDSKPLKVNSIVIVKCDNSYPLHWPLARVMELHSSPDGVVRQATVRTASGTLRRPLVKLCPLPDNCD